MEITKTLYVTKRDEWRNWLQANYNSEKEIWLIYPLKAAKKPRIPYNVAVEEALCFGWIDSIIKKLDQERNVQRFSPRKPQSSYSQTNKERLKWLIKQGKVIPEVLDSLSEVDLENFDYPIDILTAIRENKQAWKNYQKYSESYRRIRVAYIDLGRKRPGEFEKRLEHFIRKTEKDQQFGFGIEDYYGQKILSGLVQHQPDPAVAAIPPLGGCSQKSWLAGLRVVVAGQVMQSVGGIASLCGEIG